MPSRKVCGVWPRRYRARSGISTTRSSSTMTSVSALGMTVSVAVRPAGQDRLDRALDDRRAARAAGPRRGRPRRRRRRVERAPGRCGCSRCGSRRRRRPSPARRARGRRRALRVSSIQPGWETTTSAIDAGARRARRSAAQQDRLAREADELLRHLAAEAVAVAAREDDRVDLHAAETTSGRQPGTGRRHPGRPAPPVSSVPSMVAHPPVRRAPTGVPDLELLSVGWRRIQVLLRVRPVDGPLDAVGLRLRHATSGADRAR